MASEADSCAQEKAALPIISPARPAVFIQFVIRILKCSPIERQIFPTVGKRIAPPRGLSRGNYAIYSRRRTFHLRNSSDQAFFQMGACAPMSCVQLVATLTERGARSSYPTLLPVVFHLNPVLHRQPRPAPASNNSARIPAQMVANQSPYRT